MSDGYIQLTIEFKYILNDDIRSDLGAAIRMSRLYDMVEMDVI